MANQPPGDDQRRGRGDLLVGDAQQDGVGVAAVGASSEWAEHVVARRLPVPSERRLPAPRARRLPAPSERRLLAPSERSSERLAQPAATHHGKPYRGREIEGGIPFQFPQVRYRSAVR